jgi:hypothetical protein
LRATRSPFAFRQDGIFAELKSAEIADFKTSDSFAVHEERARLLGKKKARLSTDGEERHLQEVGHDIPRALARSVVREMRLERGRKKDDPKKN